MPMIFGLMGQINIAISNSGKVVVTGSEPQWNRAWYLKMLQAAADAVKGKPRGKRLVLPVGPVPPPGKAEG